MENENKINDGGPAYPETIAGTMDGIYSAKDEGHSTGMSKREVYAKAAMQGLIAGRWTDETYSEEAHKSPKRTARRAIEYADALIEALKK